MTEPPEQHNPHTIGVGGWVVDSEERVLLVRMTYGPANGRLMIPGGHADPDEMLDQTAVREVREETGIEAIPRGIVLLRQRVERDGRRDLYVVFYMTLAGGEAEPDLAEVSETIWLRPAEILARDDVQPITTELAAPYQAAPQACLARRPLTWQDEAVYRIWAGQPGRPPELGDLPAD